MDNLDPCELFPQDAYADFGVEKPGEPGTTDKGAPECAWFHRGGYLDIVLVTYEGVDGLEGRLGDTGPVEPIDGFPAYAGGLPGDEGACFYFVDVADGQYLGMQFSLNPAPEDGSICEHAREFATTVVGALVARR